MPRQVPPGTRPQGSRRAAANRPTVMGRTLIVVLLTLGLTVAGVYWTRQASLITHGCQVAEGTPPVPAFMGLLALTALTPLLRRLCPSLAPDRTHLLLAYCFLLFAIHIPSVAITRHLFPRLTVPTYFAAPDNDLGLIRDALPPWVLLHDEELVRQFFEGSEDGRVPWRPWIVPLAVWSFLILSFLTALLGLALLFHRPWTEGERLSYPLVELAWEVSGGNRSTTAAAAASHYPSLFANPLMWVGFAASALFNILNMAHAFNPAVACMGQGYDLGALFTERPLSGLRPLYIAWRPELLGLGYLVSTDIALSAWTSYLLLRTEGMVAQILGFDLPGVPFDNHQGFGAFVAMAIVLLWTSRRALAATFRRLWERGKDLPGQAAANEVLGLGLVAVGVLGMALWGLAAGVAPVPLAYYTLMLLLIALVYMRIRAQVGPPMSYVFPRDPIQAGVELLGAAWLLPRGRLKPLAALRAMEYLSRSAVQSLAGTHIETLQIASITGTSRRTVFAIIAAGLVVGLLLGYHTHLTAYYLYGCNTLEGGTTEGGYRTAQARGDYLQILSWYEGTAGRDPTQFAFRVAGALTAGGFAVARLVWFGFPLHPLGFAMASTFGYHLWGPFFLVWLAKSLILRLGGARLFRRLIPLFLGLAIGHFVVAGGVWGLLSAFSEHARRYVVWFT